MNSGINVVIYTYFIIMALVCVWYTQNFQINIVVNLLSLYALQCASTCIGTPKTTNFSFIPNGKFMSFGVEIFKYIKAFLYTVLCINK